MGRVLQLSAFTLLLGYAAGPQPAGPWSTPTEMMRELGQPDAIKTKGGLTYYSYSCDRYFVARDGVIIEAVYYEAELGSC